jgi:hypothetical protein
MHLKIMRKQNILTIFNNVRKKKQLFRLLLIH